MKGTTPHAALLASPGYGHLIPVIELGKRLVTHGFKVTVFVVPSHASSPRSDPPKPAGEASIDTVVFPPVDVSGMVDKDAGIVTVLLRMMHESLPLLRSAISAMEAPPTVLIVDLFGTEAFKMADELEMQKYVYFTSNAWFLALTQYIPVLDKEVEDKDKDFVDHLQIPGCMPVRLEDAIEPIFHRRSQMYDDFIRLSLEFTMADGILVNTWESLEPTALASLRDDKLLGRAVKVPIYPIGPITKAAEPDGSRSAVMDWLDMQPTDSVIYVSFGTGGTLSAKQTIELAWGLELSGQRFIWVLRPPTDSDAAAAYFKSDKGRNGPPDYLPDGFLSRIHNVGMVIPMWASQQEILSHSSVGGFLTHCGWNSSLESITNGVPMITWPLYAEQKMNSTLLSEELRVAIKPKVPPTDEVVDREEIEKMVRMIIEGEEGNAMRNQVKQLKYSAEKALTTGGTSHTSLSQVAKACQIKLQSNKAEANGTGMP